MNETFLNVTTGVMYAFLLFSFLLFLLGAISPFFINKMVNNPPGKRVIRSRPAFFTYIEPGQAKVIIRGETFVRAIMNNAGADFARDGNKSEHRYWWIGPPRRKNPDNEMNMLSPFNWWIWWVHKWTGAVFVGIWPFQRVRTRKLSRGRIEKKTDGTVVLDDKGRFSYEKIEDWSDHFRVRQFDWPVEIPSADTADKLKLGMRVNLRVKCVNPFLASFNVSRDDEALTNAVITEITSYVKSHTYEELLGADPLEIKKEEEGGEESGNDKKGKKEKDKTPILTLAQTLLINLNRNMGRTGSGTIDNFGYEVLEVQVVDYDPQTDPAERDALTKAWKAKQDAEAKKISADASKKSRILESEGERQARINISEGEAQAIVNRITAIKTGGEIGELLAKYDAWRDSAQAGGSTFFFGDQRDGASRQTDQLVFAKLQEIHRAMTKNGEKAVGTTPADVPPNNSAGHKPPKKGLKSFKNRGDKK